MAAPWKKGRGKLGPLAPVLGAWSASIDKPMPMNCKRTYAPFGEKYVRLDAVWSFNGAPKLDPKIPEKRREAMKKAMEAYAGKGYTETAFFGPDDKGGLCFWSFTSDGKKSEGRLAEAKDIHPDALCFEAQMPAGLARQVFWPDAEEGFRWAVESKTKKGWSRFQEHHYKPVP